MDAADGVTFREAAWLWGLLGVPLLAAFLVVRERVRVERSSALVSERIRGRSNGVRALRPWLSSVAVALIILALAGPQIGYREEEIRVSGFSRIFVLDVSDSMSATDIGGTRLQASRAVVSSLLDDAPERVALILFEGETMVLSPLTSDAEGVRTLLESVRPAETPQAGSDIGEALLAALELARGAAPDPADIVIVSDGEHQGADPAGAIQRAAESGVEVHTIMIGTRRGSTIPTENGVRADEDGRTLVTRASDDVLAAISDATGGKFLENPFVGTSVTRQLASETSSQRSGSVIIRIPHQHFQLPLGAALLLLFAAGIVNRGAE